MLPGGDRRLLIVDAILLFVVLAFIWWTLDDDFPDAW